MTFVTKNIGLEIAHCNPSRDRAWIQRPRPKTGLNVLNEACICTSCCKAINHNTSTTAWPVLHAHPLWTSLHWKAASLMKNVDIGLDAHLCCTRHASCHTAQRESSLSKLDLVQSDGPLQNAQKGPTKAAGTSMDLPADGSSLTGTRLVREPQHRRPSWTATHTFCWHCAWITLKQKSNRRTFFCCGCTVMSYRPQFG